MTKEEKIKEAWGEALKGAYCDENGWSLMGAFLSEYKIEYDSVLNNDRNYYRPKSLQGIENNNGWIKIESEADLPKETIDCFFYDNVEKAVVCGNYNSDFKKFNWSAFFVEWSEQITHYQPINKPKPPIY